MNTPNAINTSIRKTGSDASSNLFVRVVNTIDSPLVLVVKKLKISCMPYTKKQLRSH